MVRWLFAVPLGLWVVSGVGWPQDEPLDIRGMKHPALSSDGKKIAFSWHGDIWIAPAEGGPAVRVTTDPADEQWPTWSPDGLKIAFSSDKNSTRDIFVLDLVSKELSQLTHHSADDDCPAWSPDGRWIAFQSNRNPNVNQPFDEGWADIYKVPAGGGTPTRVTFYGGEHPAWSDDSRHIAFDRYSSGYGDGEHNVFVVSADGGVPRELASGEEDSRWPSWHGDQVYFAHMAHGIHYRGFANIWRAGARGGPIFQVTGFSSGHARWPSVARTADLLVFEHTFDLYAVSLRDKAPRARRLRFTVDGDPYPDRESARVKAVGGARSPAWSPDGRRFACIIEGDVWVMRADGTDARQITATIEEERDPSWTPDGTRVLFVRSSYGGPAHIYAASADGKEVQRLRDEAGHYLWPRLSPDGRLLAYFTDNGSSQDVVVVEVASGKIRFSSGTPAVDEAYPAFSPDGRRIAYLRYDPGTNRTAIVVQALEGKAETVHEEQGPCQYLDWSRDGGTMAYCDTDEEGYHSVCVLNLRTRDVQRLPRGRGMSFGPSSWSPDASKLVCEERKIEQGLEDGRATGLVVRDLRNRDAFESVTIRAERRVTLRSEMLALFLQAWGIYDRNFYDPFFHGVDWNKVREKYAPFAAACRTKAELYDLINDMIGELRASHVRLSPPKTEPKAATACLGADWEVTDEGLRVKNLDRGGPLDWAGVREGDVIVEIDGQKVKDADRQLTVPGRRPVSEVKLRLKGGAEVVVKPLGLDQLRELKYDNLIRWRKELVKERSRGRLVYHHMKFMQSSEVKRLEEAIKSEFGDAEGLILDVRDGYGGLAHWQTLSLLDARVRTEFKNTAILYTRYRSGRSAPDRFGFNPIGGSVDETVSWKRPVVLVQNEVSRSDKEILSYMFRKAGYGYTVGMPTAGGVIGGYNYSLADGSRVVVSVQGWFTAEGANMEGYRVAPDFRVPMTQEDYHAGRDPQLEKAIEVLLAQLAGTLPLPRKEAK